MPSNKQFKVFSKEHNAFQHGKYFTNCWSGRSEMAWKTLAPLLDRIERELCNRDYWRTQDNPLDTKKIEGLEIVEYEVVLKEVKRYNVKQMVIEKERERMIRSSLGYKVAAAYRKMQKEEGVDDYRYIIAFDGYDSFNEGKKRLKELDILHGRNYRFTNYVMIFKDMNDATLCRLSFADHTSDAYDLETLKKIDVEGGPK